MPGLKIEWSKQPRLNQYCIGLPVITGINRQRIIEAGRKAESIIILLSGILEVRRSLGTSEEDVAILEPLEIAGEMTFLEGKPAVVNVDVQSEKAAWIELPSNKLRADLEKDAKLAKEFYYFLTKKLRSQLLDQNSFVHRWNEQQESPDPLKKVLIIFGYLETIDLDYLASNANQITTKDNQLLIEEGKPLNHLYIILNGKFSIWKKDKDNRVKLGTSVQGEIIGELSMLDEEGRSSAEVRAENTATTAQIGIDNINQWLKTIPQAEGRWWRALAVLGSHRCREQLEGAGKLAPTTESEQFSLEELERIERAGQRFRWFCELMEAG